MEKNQRFRRGHEVKFSEIRKHVLIVFSKSGSDFSNGKGGYQVTKANTIGTNPQTQHLYEGPATKVHLPFSQKVYQENLRMINESQNRNCNTSRRISSSSKPICNDVENSCQQYGHVFSSGGIQTRKDTNGGVSLKQNE